MRISYEKLWGIMKKNRMKKRDLSIAAEISSYSMSKLNNDAPVSMEVLMRKFGPDVTTYAFDQHSFLVEATVSLGTTFYNWVFGFRGKVKIKSPESVKEAYRKLIHEAGEHI